MSGPHFCDGIDKTKEVNEAAQILRNVFASHQIAPIIQACAISVVAHEIAKNYGIKLTVEEGKMVPKEKAKEMN